MRESLSPPHVSFCLTADLPFHLSSSMILRIIAVFPWVIAGLAASVPLKPSIIQLPSQNLTILSPPSNATTSLLSGWPPTPLRRHFEWDTDIEIIDCSRPPSDPASESAILDDIRFIESEVRSEGTRLAMMQDYHRVSGTVEFAFHGLAYFTFRKSEIAMVLEAIAELTNLYGAAELYGSLVQERTDIAYFELALRTA